MNHVPMIRQIRRIGRIGLIFAALSASAAIAADLKVVAEIEVDRPLIDPSICRGPGGAYYLTGTVGTPMSSDTRLAAEALAKEEHSPARRSSESEGGTPDTVNFYENDGVYLWKSTDLKSWESMGCVIALRDQPYELYGPYRWIHKVQVVPDQYGEQRLYGVVAPEVHYARDTFWLTISMTRQGTALMKSTSGKPEGPYELVHLLTTRGGDPSICEVGEDLWWVFDMGYVSKLVEAKPDKHAPDKKRDVMKLDPRPILIQPEPEADGFPPSIGKRGAFMVRDNGTFHMIAAQPVIRDDQTVWDTFIASADRPDGPYGKRRLLIPGGGQATLFQNEKGEWLAACADGEKERLIIVEVKL